METINITRSKDDEFIADVERESGQDLSVCYQCGKCTAGCPYSFSYDIPVSQVMRLVQAGQKDTVLGSKSIWLCATCESCTTRCPNNIDVANVMDVLRHMARREGYRTEKNVQEFANAFLESVKRHGRVFELGMMADFVARTGRFWTDAELGPKLLPKGKLGFKPHATKGKDEVSRIFERFEELRRKEAACAATCEPASQPESQEDKA